jgi:pyridoxamine 5'-phosphate oxidase
MTTDYRLRDKLRALDALAGPLLKFNIHKTLDSPIDQFAQWLETAIDAGVPEPHAMSLSTVDEHGSPDTRVLLLKDLDGDGWHFGASSNSPKGRQIRRCSAVALTFYWPVLGRQVRIRGRAMDRGRERSAEDFLARSLGSRATALAGRQSEILNDPAELAREIEGQRQRLAVQPTLIDSAWTAYVVKPIEVEFWQGSSDRRHQRLSYIHDGSGWTKQLLRP